MDSDEDQQALAWQQIIRNKAFDNVRVQRGESWVDAACRTLDELIDQKEQAEKSLSESLESQPNVVWRERALEAERYLMEARRELDEEKSRSQCLVARADKANGERDAEAGCLTLNDSQKITVQEENMIDPKTCDPDDTYYGFVGGLERKLVRAEPWLDEPWIYEDNNGVRHSASDRNVSHLSTKPRFLIESEPDVEDQKSQRLHSEWMIEHIRANAAEERVRQLEDYIRGEK